MLKYSKLFLLFLFSGSFLFQSCYSRYNIPINTKTESSVSKSIKVITKNGETHELITYTISSNELVGKDHQGKRIEIPKENIKAIVGKKPNKIFVGAVIGGFGAFFLYAYLMGQFAQVGR